MNTFIIIKGLKSNGYSDVIVEISTNPLSEADGRATARFIMAMYEECIVQAPSFMDRVEKLWPALLKRMKKFA